MTLTKIVYPLYRKYSNEKSYFKVISETEFEEITVLGKNLKLHSFSAKILPEFNYIKDLTLLHNNHWRVCEPEEYEKLKQKITSKSY